MNAPVTIRDVMTDPALFGEQFGGESWARWRALLAGFYGLDLDDDELAHWKELTGREKAPQDAHDELWMVIGRRGGKSQAAALLAVFEAMFRDHRDKLAPGEVATVRVMAADRAQARSVFRYVTGLVDSNPMTRAMVVRQDRESIELNNRAVIEVGTASYRGTRGYSFACVIADEIAFWRSDDSANPDHEIVTAVRPGLATLGGPLIALSSPYSRRGELWRNYRDHYGQDDDSILVAQAASRTMNKTLPERIVEDAKRRDHAAAMAEYEGEFRRDIEAFIDPDQLLRLQRDEPLELAPQDGWQYFAFVDPAGGGADGFTLAIGHREMGGKIVVDLLRERRRAPPAEVVKEYARILDRYYIRTITGDRYAGDWPAQEFRRHGITYQHARLNRSELYGEALHLINAGSIQIPPMEKLVNQFAALERRTGASGRDVIDHPRGQHDDLANGVAGLVVEAERRGRPLPKVDISFVV